MDLSEGLRKIFLAGVGAVAATAETAKDVVDKLVEKGEITVEQGRVLNEELKRSTKEKVKDYVTIHVTRNYEDAFAAVDHMDADERARLREKLEALEKDAAAGENADAGSESGGEDAREEASEEPKDREETK